ncbi:hypothetical protein EAE32_08430 [Kocuria tytonicola]|uniref:Uncharacterized protein n=1 Tax=Kocuria tytonicola TaxID=2055946 RepID=A0A3L9L2M4_9MICC|nr:hypothetical protein [Kocuria tytonicola]RLY92428.1 hypothetical protein EAE32_08430 [Kocuria tytonicola]
MPHSSTPPAPTTTGSRAARAPREGISGLLVVALVLALLCALSLVTVLLAASGGHVIWAGFTIFPAVCFPLAFLLLCVELVRGARRRSAR